MSTVKAVADRRNRPQNEAAYRERNREKIRERHRAWRAANIEKRKFQHLSRYGITRATYEALLAQQEGRCAICGGDKPGARRALFCVDHEHATGKVRGLLCGHCNTALGLLKDDPALLCAAIKYLGRSR